jgi:hypothetical protein
MTSLNELFNISEDTRIRLDIISNGILMILPIWCTMTIFSLITDVNVFRYIFLTVLVWITGSLLYAWAFHLFIIGHYQIEDNETETEEGGK